MGNVLAAPFAGIQLHKLLSQPSAGAVWRAPDLLRKLDLIGFDVNHRSPASMPLCGELCPEDWSLERLRDLVEQCDYRGVEDADALVPGSLHLCLWYAHERQTKPPVGVFSFRLDGRTTRDGLLGQVTFHADSVWVNPEVRGQGISHYFAALVRAYLYYHVLHPDAPSPRVRVPEAGFDLRLVAPPGPPAWEKLCENLRCLFAINRNTWRGEREWGAGYTEVSSARWAICDFEVDRATRSGTVVQLRA